jgi:hypothetical protein
METQGRDQWTSTDLLKLREEKLLEQRQCLGGNQSSRLFQFDRVHASMLSSLNVNYEDSFLRNVQQYLRGKEARENIESECDGSRRVCMMLRKKSSIKREQMMSNKLDLGAPTLTNRKRPRVSAELLAGMSKQMCSSCYDSFIPFRKYCLVRFLGSVQRRRQYS